jgi:hypothetical protein
MLPEIPNREVSLQNPSPRYANRRGKPAPPRGEAYSTETPVEGCYRIRLTRGGPFVAVRIWFGPPLDPETGKEMAERGDRWQCRINGSRLVPIDRMWPYVARQPISEAEHRKLVRLSRTMDPKHAFYDPTKAINRLVAPVPF